jgi:hypothetical protein
MRDGSGPLSGGNDFSSVTLARGNDPLNQNAVRVVCVTDRL